MIIEKDQKSLLIKIIEYKIYYILNHSKQKFDFTISRNKMFLGFFDVWDLLDFGEYLNGNVYNLLDENPDYLHEAISNNKSFTEMVQDFIERNQSAKDYSPKIIKEIEEYYFGFTKRFLSYEEIFLADFICSSECSMDLYNKFMDKIETSISFFRTNALNSIAIAT